jgi:hypothetical protein
MAKAADLIGPDLTAPVANTSARDRDGGIRLGPSPLLAPLPARQRQTRQGRQGSPNAKPGSPRSWLDRYTTLGRHFRLGLRVGVAKEHRGPGCERAFDVTRTRA